MTVSLSWGRPELTRLHAPLISINDSSPEHGKFSVAETLARLKAVGVPADELEKAAAELLERGITTIQSDEGEENVRKALFGPNFSPQVSQAS